MHMLTIHEHGSSNPLGVSGNTDRIPFHPYFIFKDLVTIFLFFLVLSVFVFYMPNVLSHADNYIPANPMQTPPSIIPYSLLLISIFISFNFIFTNSYLFYNYFYIYFIFYIINPICMISASDSKGYVTTEEGKITLTKEEVLFKLNKAIKKPKNSDTFRSLANGVFQAEGNYTRGITITESNVIKITTSRSIGLEASNSSIEFFGYLYHELKNTANFYIDLYPSGKWFITIRTTSWDTCINVFIPYFSQTYAEKYTAMLKMIRINELRSNYRNWNNMEKKEIIFLIHSMNSAGVRRKSFFDKVNFILDISTTNKINQVTSSSSILEWSRDLIQYYKSLENNTPINFIWLIGFYLGDGTIRTTIRDLTTRIKFIPTFGISQKNTPENKILFSMITNFIKINKINFITWENHTEIGFKLIGKNRMRALLTTFATTPENYFWKKYQIDNISEVINLLTMNIRGNKKHYLFIVDVIYKIGDNRIKPLSFWYSRIESIFSNTLTPDSEIENYVFPLKHTEGINKGEIRGYQVKLPAYFNTKPTRFLVSNYKTLTNAKKEAIKFKNDIMLKRYNTISTTINSILY